MVIQSRKQNACIVVGLGYALLNLDQMRKTPKISTPIATITL